MIRALVARRKALGVTQAELAKRLGKTQPFISEIETCERRLDVLEFYWIGKALGTEPSELLEHIATGLREYGPPPHSRK